jgi:hypothetical protein
METFCDNVGPKCDLKAVAPLAGWVSFEEVGDRVAGRYDLTFPDGTVAGEFDTTRPQSFADAGQ